MSFLRVRDSQAVTSTWLDPYIFGDNQGLIPTGLLLLSAPCLLATYGGREDQIRDMAETGV